MRRKRGLGVVLVLLLVVSGCGVSGRVFLDDNGNGRYDAGEQPLTGVPVTDGVQFVQTGGDGRYEIDAELDPLLQPTKMSIVSVSFPSGTWPVAGWFRRIAEVGDYRSVDFPLRKDEQKLPFTFVHATDPHVPRAGKARFINFRKEMAALADRLPFCVLTGDNVDLADSHSFEQGTAEFAFLAEQIRDFPLPLFCIPGNHDAAGVKGGKGWDRRHPMFGYGYHWEIVGPLRWSFNYAGIHFVGVDFLHRKNGKWIWGVPDTAIEWLRRDLQHVAPGRRILFFVHAPQAQTKQAFDELLRKHKVEHIFAGHTHTVATGRYAGIPRTYSGSLSQIFGKSKTDRPGCRFVRVTEGGLESLYKPTGARVAVRIDRPRPGGALRPGQTVRGTLFDPEGKVKTLTVRLAGLNARATVDRRPILSAFEAKLDPAGAAPGTHTLEAAASDGRKTWACRQPCRVPAGKVVAPAP